MIKDSDAVLDYSWDWTSWLESGETIASYDLDIPDDLTVESDADDGQIVTVWLSGGTLDKDHQARCRIVTTQGRTDDRSFSILVRER